MAVSLIFKKREIFSQVATVIFGIGLFVLSKTILIEHDLPFKDAPISLSFISPPEEPEPVIEKPVMEKPVEVTPPKPVKKMVTPSKPEQPSPSPQAEPEKVMPSKNEALPVVESLVTAQDNLAAPAVSTAPKEPITASKNDDAKPTRMSNGEAEGGFAQDVKARIERKKVYPENARNLGMTGEVEVLYELDRSGNLIRAEVVTSSGHKLLDQAALKAVKSVLYGRFPDDAWIGSGSKEFRTKLVFQLN